MPRSTPSERRRWPAWLGVGILLAACVTAAGLWVSNTSDPTFRPQVAVPVATPGSSTTVATTDGECLGPFITWHRRGLLGRWQQTHLHGVRDEVPWFHLGGHELGSLSVCVESPFKLTVPGDIDRGVVAACTIDDQCVKVTVVDP